MPKVKPVFFDDRREIEVSDGEAKVMKESGLLHGDPPAATPPAPSVPPAGAGTAPAKGSNP